MTITRNERVLLHRKSAEQPLITEKMEREGLDRAGKGESFFSAFESALSHVAVMMLQLNRQF